ncbi:MAG: M1 family metallopeptidase, partial [Calditrichaeota bacterium]|nr:M1 family metallopeptidase [Calditrichota bacterium]
MKRARTLPLWLLLPLAFVSAQTTQTVWFNPPLSPRIANYDIDVQLDPEAKLLTAREVIRWRNATSKPTSTLQFHLYMNAFRNSESTFMREVSARSRYRKRNPEDWGWVEIDTLLLGGTDLLSASRFIQPDDGNSFDRTVLEV